MPKTKRTTKHHPAVKAAIAESVTSATRTRLTAILAKLAQFAVVGATFADEDAMTQKVKALIAEPSTPDTTLTALADAMDASQGPSDLATAWAKLLGMPAPVSDPLGDDIDDENDIDDSDADGDGEDELDDDQAEHPADSPAADEKRVPVTAQSAE